MPNYKITVTNLADTLNTIVSVGQQFTESGVALSLEEVTAEVETHLANMHGPQWSTLYSYTIESV